MYMPSLFDLAIIRMLRQTGYARKIQIVAWTDSSIGYVNEALARTHRAGLVDHATVPADLLNDTGHTVRSLTEVWFATAAGLRHLEPAVVPGSRAEVVIRPLRPTGTLTSHTLAVADVLTGLRAWGWDVASERLVRAAEQPTKTRPHPQQYWTVPTMLAAAKGVHPLDAAQSGRSVPLSRMPDGVAVHPDGAELSVEVELATTKPREELLRVLASHYGAGRAQAWFVGNGSIMKALAGFAQESLGVTGEPATYGDQKVWAAGNRMIFLTRYRSGPRVAADVDPKASIPMTPPLGIAAERSGAPRGEWLVSQDAVGLVHHRDRHKAERDAHDAAEAAQRAEHDAAEALLVRRALAQRLAPGTYDIDGVARTWDGATWSAPDLDSLWDVA